MTKKALLSEIIISGLILVLLSVFLINPNGMWLMPESVQMILVAMLAALFLLFALLVWQEQARDERDQLHQLTSSRSAFFAGSTVLVIATIVQSLNHEIDPWIIITLGVMLISKISSRIYTRNKN